MPGRHGYAQGAGWVNESGSTGVPQNISYNARNRNVPLEYKASESIEFIAGFQSEIGDSFTAYITSEGSNESGSGLDGNEGLYRYGFNGKENDNEVKGEGAQQNYGMRIYDPRLGRFLSVDPIASEFPWNGTYAYAENDPINFIDLDGLEKGSPVRPGSSRSSGGGLLTGYGRQQAQGAARSLRQSLQTWQRSQNFRHLRNLANNPSYRANSQLTNTIVQSQQVNQYWQNAFNSASIALTGGTVQDNKKLGDAWDNFVRSEMLKNPDYVGVARQVSIKVTGMVNGQMSEAKIRMDNVGIRKDPVTGNPLFDFKEAKYSIEQITINNVAQTLTPQQKAAANILINGTNVQMFIRGNGSTDNMNTALQGTGQRLVNGQNITAQVSAISIVVPSQSQASNGVSTSSTNQQTNQNSSNGSHKQTK
jgi:RHS repeat-associated protein